MRKNGTTLEGIRRTVSPLILAMTTSCAAAVLWAICRTTDIAHAPQWSVATIVFAACSAYGLRSRWRRLLRAAYQEGYADGYIRRAADELDGADSTS